MRRGGAGAVAIVDRAADAKARAVMIDVLLAEADAGDDNLAAAMKRIPTLIVSVFESSGWLAPAATIRAAAEPSDTTLTAISSTGAKKWTATLSNHGRLLLSDGNLIQASETRNSDGTFTTTLTAISTTSGSTAWTKSVSGRITELVPFNGGTYAFVVIPATTSGGTATRSLVAYGNDGSVLWTVAL